MCGILGLYAPHDEVARVAYFGLFALQHRGQEAAGIAVCDGYSVRMHKGQGLLTHAFDSADLKPLEGHGPFAIGHTRYSTTGSSDVRNAHPFLIETRHGPLAVAHNGNLVNAAELRQKLLDSGVGLSTSSDTEVITMMLAGAAGDSWEERIRHCMPSWEGAYSLVVLTRDGVYAVRDPHGFRPLVVGELPGGGQVAASETGALHTLGCTSSEEVQPGQIALLGPTPGRFPGQKPARPTGLCVFEHIYFSRSDSVWDALSVHKVRQRLGEELFREAAVEADVVIPVPDSSVPAAIGYSRVSGVPYNDGFIKNRYIGRTFIQPTDSLRRQGVAMKFNPLAENLAGRRVVMIDDSIVRGNTSGPLVKMLRQAGATEVHLRITSPPIKHPCYMGVDMGTYDELISHRHSVEEIRQLVGADSLYFLSMEGVYRALGRQKGYCDACFTGCYPVTIRQDQSKTGFEGALASAPGRT